MTSSIYTDALLIITYIFSQLWLVLVSTLILVRQRERKLPYYCLPTLGLSKHYTETTSKPVAVQSLIRPLLIQEALPVYKSAILTPNDTQPHIVHTMPLDQLTIHIEPDGTPTTEQQNIQRIIKHLKDMSNETKVAS